MVRVLSVVVACLCVLVWWEAHGLVELKAEVGASRSAQQESAAALHAFEHGHDEMVRTVNWLQAYIRSDEGLRRAGGLCTGDRLDAAGLGNWLAVYLQARVDGASEADARRAVTEAIRRSPGWQQAHAAASR